MPSPPSDDNSPISRSPNVSAGESLPGQAPLSRTGKFFQGMFGKKARHQPVASLPEKQPLTAKTPSIEQPPQELIQVMPEPTDWGDEEESNWDDDFMDEPAAAVPSSPPPPPPPSLLSKPAPPSVQEAEAPLESEQLIPPTPVETEPAPPSVQEAPLESEQLTPPAPVETEPAPPPVQATAQQVTPPVNNPIISVNIPRPKNIKYRTKSPETAAAKSYTADAPAADSPPDKVEGVELHIKRPTTVKYKAKPLPQASLMDRIVAPGKELWQKVQNWGDIIPSQLTENPKKILGILAAVLLSIVTSWAVVNFWPSSAVAPVAVGQPVVAPTSPAETFVQAVKSQLSTLASQYPAGLITNLELDNERQVAIVTLGSLWASLPANQQQQVAQSLWQQSRTYQMSKLEMRSDNGNLLARSPIVGQDMVILSNW